MAMNVERYNEYFCWSHSSNNVRTSSSDPDNIASLIAESLNSFTFLETLRKCSLCGSPWGWEGGGGYPLSNQLCKFRIGNLLTWSKWALQVWIQNRPYLVPLLRWTLSLLRSSDFTLALAFSILLLLFAKTRPFDIINAFL